MQSRPGLQVNVQNRQRAVRVNLSWLRRFAPIALEKCRAHSGDQCFALDNLSEIEVAIVSDHVMARLHQRFLGQGGSTDVITFDHGEIVISAETALANAARYRHSVDEEIALYTVHGLLHLNGFEDATLRDAARLRTVQNRVMKVCLSQLPPPNL
jgi:probable rRNA maturation factor